MAPDLRDRVLDAAREAGLDAVGVASAEPFDDTRTTLEERKAKGLHGGMAFTYRNPTRSTDPARALDGARSLVVAAMGYRRQLDPSPADHDGATATVARYSWTDYYTPLRHALDRVLDVLEADGWRGRVLVDDNALVDRAAAHRAGLGWYGKNANLLIPGRGSWFVLGSVVTDAPLEPTATSPLTTEEGCGSCTRCLPACPTGALVAPGVLDARRCLAWLLEASGPFPREHRIALGDRIYGCDDCQTACPPNRLDERRLAAPPAGVEAEPFVDVLALLAMTDDELLERFGRWYIGGRDPAHLRRNALVVLGNVGDGTDDDVRNAVATALLDHRDVVRSTAVWTAARLALDDLIDGARVATDPSPLVRDELGELPPPRTG